MQGPAKSAAPRRPQYMQSKRLESVRKDVECTFGLALKGSRCALTDKVRFLTNTSRRLAWFTWDACFTI